MSSRAAAQKGINKKDIKPAVAALTVALSFFIGMMSIFVAVLALAVAGRQGNPNAGSDLGWSNSTAAALAWFTGGLAILNSLLAFARARMRPGVTALCVVLFIFTTLMANVLFVRAW